MWSSMYRSDSSKEEGHHVSPMTAKSPQAPRIMNTKRSRESDVEENSSSGVLRITRLRITQLRKSASKQKGGSKTQGAPVCAAPSKEKGPASVDDGGDMGCSSVPRQPPTQHPGRQRVMTETGGCSPAGQSTSSGQDGQESLRESLFRQIDDLVCYKHVKTNVRKAELVRAAVSKFADDQEAAAQVHIANFRREAEIELAEAMAEIAFWNREACIEKEARSSLQAKYEGLQRKVSADIENFRTKLLQDLNGDLPDQAGSGLEGAGLHFCPKKINPTGISRGVVELNKSIHRPMLEVHKRSQEHESCVEVLNPPGEEANMLEPKSRRRRSQQQVNYRPNKPRAQNVRKKRRAAKAPQAADGPAYLEDAGISGSYVDGAGNPDLLHSVFCNTKVKVTTFQKELVEAMTSMEENRFTDLLSPHVFFVRPGHLGFYVKSALNKILFEGFENESFNTISGTSRFLDPNLRQANFYAYYQKNSCGSGGDLDHDPQFDEFYNAKVSSLWKLVSKRSEDGGEDRQLSSFEELGGSAEVGSQLALYWKEAVRSVWLLHKLAFSFEPPASIFRVERGANVDPYFMDVVVQLEDSERFVPKAGFMITPGLRLRKTVLQCEVYLWASL